MFSLNKFIEIRLDESKQQARQARKRNAGKIGNKGEKELAKISNFNFEYEPSYDTKFIPTTHASAQAKQRRPDLKEKDWARLHNKVYWYISDNGIKSGVYLFYNEEMRQGYVAKVSKGGKEVKIITVLPKSRFDPNMGSKGKTELALVEEIQAALDHEGIIFESSMIQTVYV